MDLTIAGDLQLSDTTGHRIATLPEKTTSYSYTTDSWYLGVFAWVFIAAVIGHGIYTLMNPVRIRRMAAALSSSAAAAISSLAPKPTHGVQR
jgi:hypothetical protein